MKTEKIYEEKAQYWAKNLTSNYAKTVNNPQFKELETDIQDLAFHFYLLD